MKTVLLDKAKQSCRGFGIADIKEFDGPVEIGENVLMSYPNNESSVGCCVKIDEEKGLIYMQRMGLYGWHD